MDYHKLLDEYLMNEHDPNRIYHVDGSIIRYGNSYFVVVKDYHPEIHSLDWDRFKGYFIKYLGYLS